jgi:hypothetical protein
MGSCTFEAEEAAYGKRLEENAAILRDKINEAMNCWSKKMEREKFIECRDKIVEILLSSPDVKAEAPDLCASALNEVKADSGFYCRIQFHRSVDYVESNKI